MPSDHHPIKSPFAISGLAAFDKAIESDTQGDKRRKRLAYLSVGMSQLGYGESLYEAMGCTMIPFIIIPFIWPNLILMYVLRKRMMRRIDEQIGDALRYWDIHRFELDQFNHC